MGPYFASPVQLRTDDERTTNEVEMTVALRERPTARVPWVPSALLRLASLINGTGTLLMKSKLLRGVILGALATMTAGVSTMTQADGTASAGLNGKYQHHGGTCSASVLDGETATDTIAFGSVSPHFGSFAKTKSKALSFALQ